VEIISASTVDQHLTRLKLKARKNAIVEYLDYQTVTQLKGPKGDGDI